MVAMQSHRYPRLIRLALEVKTNPRQRPSSLFKTLKISKPQFYKDKLALAEIGFSFHYSRSQGRFVISQDPFIPAYDLTLTETLALTMAVRQLSAAGDFTLTYDALSAIKKIVANSPATQREILCSCLDDTVLRKGFGCSSQILEDLHKAVLDQRRVVIRYDLYQAGGLKEYTLDPYQIYFKRRALYLDALCPQTQNYLVFRINRIKELRPTGMLFSRRPDYNFARRHRNSFSVFVGEKTEKVKVRFDKRLAPFIKESLWHHSQRLEEEPNGSLLFEVEVSEPREVGWWVMQWGPEAEVLEPESLRNYVADMARGIVGVYEKM